MCDDSDGRRTAEGGLLVFDEITARGRVLEMEVGRDHGQETGHECKRGKAHVVSEGRVGWLRCHGWGGEGTVHRHLIAGRPGGSPRVKKFSLSCLVLCLT